MKNPARPLVLSFDLGTQSARALLVDAKGQIVAKCQKVYEKPYLSPYPGWAEQEADFYWSAICEVSAGLREKSPENWEDIIAVTVSTIRDTCLCLDKNGDPLRNVILWLDKREAHAEKSIPLTSSFLFSLVHMNKAVELQRKISACNWIAEHEPEVWEKTDKFVLLSAWITQKLCGCLVDSVASTVGHIPFDSKIRGWMRPTDMRRCIFNVRDDMLYQLVEPGSVFGSITQAASEDTGIPAGLPLIATGSDKACETLGLGCLTSDKAAISFGTTATIELTTDNYVEPMPYAPPYPAVVGGKYNPEVEIYRGYWLISWFKREFAAKEVQQALEQGVAPEQLLNARLHEVPAGCDGLLFQPYFTPGVMMPHAKGAAIGFSDVHTRLHIYRAIIEGINFALMDGLYEMQKRSQTRAKALYVAGGASQSSEICQITANMFGLPLYRVQTHEVTGVGSALVAFVACGVYSGYEEAVAHMVHEQDCFTPDPKEHKIYAKLYDQVFSHVFDKLVPLYEQINEILSGE